MKIQFVFNNNYNKAIDLIADRVLTKEEVKKVEHYVFKALETHEEKYGELVDFDFYRVCKNAINQFTPIVERPVDVTLHFHIFK